MVRVRRVLAAFALLLIIGYAGGLVWLVASETRIVFESDRPLGEARPSPPFELLEIPRQDGRRQIAFAIPGRDSGTAPWVLYLHGNAGTIASRRNISHNEQLRALGLNVLAIEYRGYAGLPGVPSEAGVTDDARAGYEYLTRTRAVAADRIVLYGWSLGSAVAVNLASEVPVGAVVLEGAPASLVAIGQRRYPFVPVRLLMRNPFESVLKIARVRAPILFLHSPEDTVVPIAEGRRLFDAANEPKAFVEVKGGHLDAGDTDGATMYRSVAAFLHRARILSGTE